MNPRRLLPLLAAAALAAAATPAHAGQFVYAKDGSIWAANDDGSNQHVIANWTDVPDSRALTDPSVQPNGTQVAFTAEWSGIYGEENRWIPFAPGAGGVNSLAVYRLQGGSAARLTKPPFGCPLAPCSQIEARPQVATDGRTYYESDYYQWDRSFGSWAISATKFGMGVRAAGSGQGDGITLPAACAGDDRFGPAPNPVNPAQYAYAGCTEGAFGPYDIYLSGATGDTPLGSDDQHVEDLSWTPDGTHVVDAEGGDGPGLWTISTDTAHPSAAWMIDMSAANGWGSPQVLADGRVAFVANGDLWIASARCQNGGSSAAACHFPGDATRLVAGVGNRFGWTSSTQPIAPLAHAVGGGGSTAPAPAPAPQPAPRPLPVPAPKRTVMSLRVRGASARKGIRLDVRLRKAARVKVTVTKLHAKHALGTVTFRGRKGANTLVIHKVGRHRLTRGRFRLTVAVAGDPARRLTVTVKR